MSDTKRFGVRTILTCTTGRFLCLPKGADDNGIGDLYELLGFMTDDSPHTHQLGRFSDECKPWLLRWFPELEKVDATIPSLLSNLKGELRADEVEAAIAEWIGRVKFDIGTKDFYDVPRIPKDDHERKNSYGELVSMRGTDEGIIRIG